MKRRLFPSVLSVLLVTIAGCASPSNDSTESQTVAPIPTLTVAPIATLAPEATVAPIPVATATPFVLRRTESVDVAPQSLEETFPVQEITPDRADSRRSRTENSRPQLPRSSAPRRERIVRQTESAPIAPQGGQVWVNTNSDVYHMPGMRYYGKTKEGYYASEEEAKRAGFRRATR